MAFVPLPIIGELALKFQFSILAILLVVSYIHRTSRLAFSGVITLYAGYKFLVPVSVWIFGWTLWLAKGIAMLGFYIHFFQLGLGYLATGVSYLSSDFHEWLVHGLEAYESSRS